MWVQAKYWKGIYKKMNEVSPSFREKTTGSICSWWQTALELSNSNHNTGKLEFPTVNLTTSHYPMTMRLSDEIGVRIKNVSFSYCVMKYVSIWKIWANIIQMAKTTCWNEFIESNTKVYSCNYTFGDRRHEKSKKFKANFNYTQSSNPDWATWDSDLKQK